MSRILYIGILTLLMIQTATAQNDGCREFEKKMEMMADSLIRHLQPWKVSKDRTYRVENFGAKADGTTVNTASIQQAINVCSKDGGGYVVFSSGDYVTGTIELRQNVMLKVERGARLLGSTDLKDYPEKVEHLQSVMRNTHRYRLSLIYAERTENIGICGEGEIYFRGERQFFPGPETTGCIEGRPFGIRFIQCSNIVVKGITLRNSAAWMQNYLVCKNVIIDGIKVVNTNSNYNCDGLDPDGCKNVIIRNCHIESHDDALCLKSASGQANENFLIENCNLFSTCNAFKFGTDTQGDFRNIYARNLVLGALPDPSANFLGRDDCSTGITMETVDGGNVENILIQNVNIRGSRCPIFLYIGDRGRVWNQGKPSPGFLRNVLIQNVTGCDNRAQGSLITGIPERKLENITLRNVYLQTTGGGKAELRQRKVPLRTHYPDAQEYLRDGLPAYGFYLRHTKNVILEHVQIIPTTNDERECFICGEDNDNLKINY